VISVENNTITKIQYVTLPGADIVLAVQGKVSLLRVHEIGSGYGPPSDQLDVEVVVQLESHPEEAFGFQLRSDANEAAHRRMLDLLRDAFNSDRTVRIDYLKTGRKTGRIIRASIVF